MRILLHMNKVLLYYKYVAIQYPKQIVKWQQKVCADLELTGRVLISHEGINGTLGGTTQSIDRYKKIISEHPLFSAIDFKESDGSAECFPRMSIKIRPEAVSLGIPHDALTPRNSGTHLTPQETHTLITNNPDNLLIFDARNNYESKIGKFTNAVTPDIENFRDLPHYINENIEQFKNKQVLMYCTGGIRCERASAYLNEKGVAQQVYQMNGGIHRYTEEYPDGFFRGKNYVFDSRIALKINDDILSACEQCAVPYDDYNNCLSTACNRQFICCPACTEQLEYTCSKTCLKLVKEKKVTTRQRLQKIEINKQAHE